MIGFLLISIGTAITYLYNDFDFFIADHYFSPAALLIAVGIIIFFVSLFGCAGAIKGSVCMVNVVSTIDYIINSNVMLIISSLFA